MIFKHLVVVLPGISGSVLSKDGKEVWGASTVAIWQAVTSGPEKASGACPSRARTTRRSTTSETA